MTIIYIISLFILIVIVVSVFSKKKVDNIDNGKLNHQPKYKDSSVTKSATKYYPTPTDIKIIPPAEPTDTKVRSYSDPSIEYIVNLSTLSCTCPDFNKRRIMKAPGSLERVCKHQKSLLLLSGKYAGTLIDEVLKDEYHSQYYYIHSEFPAVFGYTIQKEWINVWAAGSESRLGKISFGRFGYSLLEERWSFGNFPRDQNAIEEIIQGVFPLGDHFTECLNIHLSEIPERYTFSISDERHKEVMNNFYDLVNSILLDDNIDDEEIISLKRFITTNAHYLGVPPLNDIYTLLQTITKDGRVSKKERDSLKQFLLKIGNAIR